MKATHLTYFLRRADENGVRQHAQLQMKQLGITYVESVPQSMYDCWEFWCCDNVPEELPVYIRSSNENPINSIGYGLYAKEAIELLNKINQNGLYVVKANPNERQKNDLKAIGFDLNLLV